MRIERRLGDQSNPAVFSLELHPERGVDGTADAVYRIEGQRVRQEDFDIALRMCGGSSTNTAMWLLLPATEAA